MSRAMCSHLIASRKVLVRKKKKKKKKKKKRRRRRRRRQKKKKRNYGTHLSKFLLRKNNEAFFDFQTRHIVLEFN
ncbi:hypothetical protein WN51_07044 [Melipona quadrifasciata]|uniref:Uncharacterized protein n=1 Tax=Melipona quadrifasciata TaxID=166423 RepID=A0A0M8ZR64_9HYME|nr:hypothetical protein WN51_07044 [Melipona quadrifasciata]